MALGDTKRPYVNKNKNRPYKGRQEMMVKRTAAILAFIEAHPECTADDIRNGTGITKVQWRNIKARIADNECISVTMKAGFSGGAPWRHHQYTFDAEPKPPPLSGVAKCWGYG